LLFRAGQILDDAGKPIVLDGCIFADTGEEPAAVYEHLKWLQSLGAPLISVRDSGIALGDDLTQTEQEERQRFASIPAFVRKPDSDVPGMLRRQCSAQYKIIVVEFMQCP